MSDTRTLTRTILEDYVGPLRGRLATTSAGVEIGLIRVMLAIRLANVIQLWVAIPALYASLLHPRLNVALAVFYTVHSVAAVLITAHRGTLAWPQFVAVDVAVMCFLLTVEPRTVPVAERVGTWAAWAHPLSLSTAVLLAVSVRLGWSLLGLGALITAYLATALPTALGTDKQWTVMTNAVTFLAFALMGTLIAPYLRRLGAAADEGHRAAEVVGASRGAEAEMERHRLLLHDHAALLSFIGNRMLEDPKLSDAVARQALDGSRAVQAFLASSSGEPSQAPLNTLADVARDAARRFPDLPLTVNVDLAENRTLEPAVATSVRDALHTLLANVRRHASASSCVIHASAAPHGWELSVRDDGIGFDPATTPMSFGLSKQVRAACHAHGLDVQVESAPGEGTAVTIATAPAAA